MIDQGNFVLLIDRTSYFNPLKIETILESLKGVIPDSEQFYRVVCRLIAVRPVGDLNCLFESLVGLVKEIVSLDAHFKNAYFELVHECIERGFEVKNCRKADVSLLTISMLGTANAK